MSLKIRKIPDHAIYGLIAAHNLRLRAPPTLPHADVTSLTSGDYQNPVATPYIVAGADATTLAGAYVLAAEIRAVRIAHYADAMAHRAADATVIAAPLPSSQGTLNTWANETKANLNTHEGSVVVHFNADATNTIATADATDQATSIALTNAIKAKLNAHIINAQAGQTIELVSA